METTFTNVFYEETYPAAEERLNNLRKIDKYPEIKAYIIQVTDGSWRVLRKIRIQLQQPHCSPVSIQKVQKKKRLKVKKTGL